MSGPQRRLLRGLQASTRLVPVYGSSATRWLLLARDTGRVLARPHPRTVTHCVAAGWLWINDVFKTGEVTLTSTGRMVLDRLRCVRHAGSTRVPLRAGGGRR